MNHSFDVPFLQQRYHAVCIPGIQLVEIYALWDCPPVTAVERIYHG
jgi:hypothetical protein